MKKVRAYVYTYYDWFFRLLRIRTEYTMGRQHTIADLNWKNNENKIYIALNIEFV